MVRQPLFQICGIANISLIWKFFRLYKINIKHMKILLYSATLRQDFVWHSFACAARLACGAATRSLAEAKGGAGEGNRTLVFSLGS